jgi:hypothetical protein
MSEFTYGTLFLTENRRKIQQAAQSYSYPYIIKKLNRKWTGFFSKATDYWEQAGRFWLLETSLHVPLLYLADAEDHGWTYRVIQRGLVRAEVNVDYELLWGMAERLAGERHPEWRGNLMDAILENRIDWGGIQSEVLHSTQYQQALDNQFIQKNVDELAVFRVIPKKLREIDSILTTNWYLENTSQQVQRFKELLGIKGFSWTSHRHLSRDKSS